MLGFDFNDLCKKKGKLFYIGLEHIYFWGWLMAATLYKNQHKM